MRRNIFKDVPTADYWLTEQVLKRQNAVCKQLFESTKLTDLIYKSLSFEDIYCGTERVEYPVNIEALAADLFTALFSPIIRRKDDRAVRFRERIYNKPILEKILGDDNFDVLKKLCEDRELISYEAASSFARALDNALEDKPDENNVRYIKIIQILNEQADEAIEHINKGKASGLAPKKMLYWYNRAKHKLSQAENLKKKLKDCALCYVVDITDNIKVALNEAVINATKVSLIISAWGTDSGKAKNIPANKDLLDHVKNSEVLLNISKSLGKYRQMIINKRKNGFAYGRGEKYDLTLGNDITNCLTGEVGLLGTAQTEILFMRKYEQKRLQQYRKRTRIVKGKGDFIILLDESISTAMLQPWAKAFALAMLDIASKDNRKCAIVHFASADEIKVDIFEPKKYTAANVMQAAEHFFNGGTNFEKPLSEALSLMKNGFENADITIITDGECEISDEFATDFKNSILKYKATVTGVLLDKDKSCGDSLVPFCDKIYHSKEITEDEIAIDILNKRAS